MKPKISIVIPSLNAPKELFDLIGQLDVLEEKEIIIVNQNPNVKVTEIFTNLIEINLSKPVSASAARNIGASHATAEFIFFLDDDAILYMLGSNQWNVLLKSLENIDVIVFDRCFINSSNHNISSYNPSPSVWNERHWSIIKFVTEWNVCIRKSVFFNANAFPNIGVGSSSKAQSGEIFVLISSIHRISKKFLYFPNISIIHPPYSGSKPLKLCLGYYYGAGYSVALSFKYFSAHYKLLWIIRSFLAAFRDLGLKRKDLLVPNDFDKSFVFYKLRIANMRLKGLIEGLINIENLP